MEFVKYLTSKRLVPAGNAKFYKIWVDAFSRHLGKDITGYSPVSQEEIDAFLTALSKTKEDWQVKQAKEAIRLFLFYLSQAGNGKNRVQELLGHTHLSTTMIYTHVAQKKKLAVVSPLDEQ